jgi:hypothetical protein
MGFVSFIIAPDFAFGKDNLNNIQNTPCKSDGIKGIKV